MAKQLYKLYLDDYSAASFTSFDKCYVGTLDDIGNFVSSIKNDKNISDNHSDLISAYEKFTSVDTSVMHMVAHQNTRFLTRVKCLGCNASSLTDYNWEHTNTWGFPYYMHCKKVDSTHLWISSDRKYFRCIKSNFTNLTYNSADGQNIDIGDRFWGFPHQVEHNAPDTYNRLFVIEKEFGTKAEALQDMEAFKIKPDVNFTEVLNDIFGDG
ncbi:MAG: hypothetical protein II996_07610 [Oscillospiraceae bacterium]|nr:hypothetical protein [Oscillospiraceae bacterium]